MTDWSVQLADAAPVLVEVVVDPAGVLEDTEAPPGSEGRVPAPADWPDAAGWADPEQATRMVVAAAAAAATPARAPRRGLTPSGRRRRWLWVRPGRPASGPGGAVESPPR
jgi:hypothetical protein